MAKVIKIFNPRDIPYGPLSNNAQHFMELDGRRWRTVTNYIYANLLTAPTYRISVGNVRVKDVKAEYNTLYQRTIDDATTKALDEALEAKFKDAELAEALVATGNAPIVYVSGNPLLGTGPDNAGVNLYGKMLVQLRHRLRTAFGRKQEEESKQEWLDQLYTAYKANEVLNKAMRDGSNLSEYMGLTLVEIVEKNGDKKIPGVPPRETVVQMYERGGLKHIAGYVNDPHMLVVEKRKRGLRALRTELLRKQKECVLSMYTRYLLEKNKDSYPTLKEKQYEKAVEQQLAKLDYQSKTKLMKRVWDLFEAGQLSGNLSDCIDEKIVGFKVPSEQEVVEAESVEIAEGTVVDVVEGESKVQFKKTPEVAPVPQKELSAKDQARLEEIDEKLKELKLKQPAPKPRVVGGQKRPSRPPPPDPEMQQLMTERLAIVSKVAGPSLVDEIVGKMGQQRKPWAPPVPRYMEEAGEPIIVYPFSNEHSNPVWQQFSPLEYHRMMTIGGKQYPSVTHYLFAVLFALIPEVDNQGNVKETGINKAYTYILVDPQAARVTGPESFLHPDTLTRKYDNTRDISYAERIKKYAVVGMDKKFQDRRLQDLLVMTGKATLLWNDFSDPILGVGTRETGGDNFVGKYLMGLRAKYEAEHAKETVHHVTEADITRVLGSDPFMMEWVKMRVRDMCTTVMSMKHYLWVKYEIAKKVDAKFAEAVLNQVYNPCGALGSLAGNVKAEVPRYFAELVKSCVRGKRVDDKIVNVFWTRITTMVHFLIKFLEVSTMKNIKAVLANVEAALARKQPCAPVIKDEEDNCIVSAILNLLGSIKKFNELYGYDATIRETDVKMVATLILDRDVLEEVKPILEGVERPKPSAGNTPSPPAQEFLEEQLEEEGVLDEDDESEVLGYDEEEDVDYGDWDDEPASAFPGGKTSDEDTLAVQDAIKVLDDSADSQEVTRYIFGALETIKTYNIDKNVKQNRINFFATLR